MQTPDHLPQPDEPLEETQENTLDDIRTRIADKVREDSKNLARPIVVDLLEPLFTETDPPVDFAEMAKDDRYQDIQLLLAPAGTIYIYSNAYITPAEAIAKSALDEAQAKIAAKVREDSKLAKLTGVDLFHTLVPQLEPGEPEAHLLTEMAKDDKYQDIKPVTAVTGAVYVYSETYITKNYAAILVRVEANDPLLTISETVREESRVYPRPTTIELFREPLFGMDVNEIETHVAHVLKQPEFKDIKELVASTGTRYLYSDLYMSKEQARSSVEWLEVEQFENP